MAVSRATTDGNRNRASPDSQVKERPIPEGESGALVSRLKQVIGDESVSAFSRRCGVSEAGLRSYVNDGRMPSIDKALAIAQAGGVTLDWLATGRGPKTQAELRALQAAPSPASVAALDLPRLQAAIATVEEGLTATRRVMDPDRKAELILAVYDLFEDPAATRDLVLRLVKSAA